MTIYQEYNDYIEKLFVTLGDMIIVWGNYIYIFFEMGDSFNIISRPAKYFVPVDSNNLCQKDYHENVFNSISRRLHLCIFSFSIILWSG